MADLVKISKKIGAGSGKGVPIARWFQQLLGDEQHKRFLKVIAYDGSLEDFTNMVSLWTETKFSELYDNNSNIEN